MVSDDNAATTTTAATTAAAQVVLDHLDDQPGTFYIIIYICCRSVLDIT